MTPYDFECPAFASGEYYIIRARAMRTATPGIIITEAHEIKGAYRLTHEVSGMAITTGDYATSMDSFGLFTLADALAGAGDWRRSAPELCADEDLGVMVRHLVTTAPVEWLGLARSKEHEDASLRARKPALN